MQNQVLGMKSYDNSRSDSRSDAGVDGNQHDFFFACAPEFSELFSLVETDSEEGKTATVNGQIML